jgi:hypothetical protein
MVSRIATIAIDANDPRLIADFWAAVLGWQIVEEDAGGITIAPDGAAWPTIDVLKVPGARCLRHRLKGRTPHPPGCSRPESSPSRTSRPRQPSVS